MTSKRKFNNINNEIGTIGPKVYENSIVASSFGEGRSEQGVFSLAWDDTGHNAGRRCTAPGVRR